MELNISVLTFLMIYCVMFRMLKPYGDKKNLSRLAKAYDTAFGNIEDLMEYNDFPTDVMVSRIKSYLLVLNEFEVYAQCFAFIFKTIIVYNDGAKQVHMYLSRWSVTISSIFYT